MPSRRLSARMRLDVELSATITRNLLERDPQPVIDELRRLAGNDIDLLAEVAGTCAGWYASPDTAALCDALATQIDGAAPWVLVGRERRSRGNHGAPRD